MLGDEVSVLTVGPHIWALDDEPQTLELLEHIFVEGGYQFTGFTSATAFRAHMELVMKLPEPTSARPDLMLLDLMLPDDSGITVLRDIQGHHDYNHIPRVVLTADSSESSMINAFDAGAHDIIRKPFSVLELMARVKLHINALRHVRSLQSSFDDMALLAKLSTVETQPQAFSERPRYFSDMLCRGLHLANCELLIVDTQSGQLRWSPPDGASVQMDLRSEPILSDDLRSGRPRELSTADMKEMQWPPILYTEQTYEVDRAWFVPLISRSELLGLLLVFTSATRHMSSTRLQRVIVPAANIIAGALSHERATPSTPTREGAEQVGESEQVEHIQDYLLQVIAASPNAIVAARRDGQIVIFNQTARDILGWTQEEAMRMNVRELYPPTVAKSIMRRLRDPHRDGVGRLRQSSEWLRDRHDHDIPVMLSASILYDEQGREAGSVGVFTDMRKRIQLERELERAEADLEASRERVVMAELAGATAHELNQPLTSLLAYVELLQSTLEKEDVARTTRALETITAQAQRLADIVSQLANITQYRTRNYVGEHRIIDFGEGEER